MRKRTAIILYTTAVALVAVACSPFVIHRLRERQFRTAQGVVESCGGRLNFDLVDGNYMLDLEGANDATVAGMIETLRELPTGFTLLGPGEGRQYWITISDSSISDAGFAALCDLDVTFLTLSDCPRLTDASATTLSQFTHTHVNISGNIPFSDDALVNLDSSLGYWLYPRIADTESGEPSDAPKDRASRFDNGKTTAGPR